MSAPQRLLIVFFLSAAVGFLGAKPFAEATGIEASRGDETVLVIISGIVLGFATMAAIAVAKHAGAVLIALLRQANRRPEPKMAIACVVSGTVCILFALAFEWYLAASTQVVRPGLGGNGGSVSFSIPDVPQGKQTASFSVSGSGQLQIGKAASPVGHLLAIGVFLIGAILASIGVWSSMTGEHTAHAPASAVPST